MISEHLSQLLDAKIEQGTQDPSIKTQEMQPIWGGANCTIVSVSFICLSAPSQSLHPAIHTA